jgi:hypothetical protein
MTFPAHIVTGIYFFNLPSESDTETFETETDLRFSTVRCREPRVKSQVPAKANKFDPV